MKKKIIIMYKIIFLLVLFLPFAVKSSAQNDEQKMQVMMKMLSLKNSLLSRDSVTLSSVLADDVTYGHTSGLIQTKQQLINDVTSGVQSYKSIEPSNINVRIYDNTAIVTMNSHANLVFNGKPLDMNIFITLVWIKENGDWKLEARQSVKLQE